MRTSLPSAAEQQVLPPCLHRKIVHVDPHGAAVVFAGLTTRHDMSNCFVHAETQSKRNFGPSDEWPFQALVVLFAPSRPRSHGEARAAGAASAEGRCHLV